MLSGEDETNIEQYNNCIFCYLKQINEPVRIGKKNQKKGLKIKEIFNDPYNLSFLKILIQILDGRVLENKSLYISSRKYFLSSLLNETKKIKPKHDNIQSFSKNY